MLKRSVFILAAMVAVVGCGNIRIPVGETNVRVGLPADQTVNAPITDGKVDRVIGSPVSLDRGSPVSLDGVSADKIGADHGSWSLKGAKLGGAAASVQGVKSTATSGTLGITATVKLKFFQGSTVPQDCSGTEVYTALENVTATAQVDANGNIGDLGGTLSQANLNNLVGAIKVLVTKTNESKVAGATPWQMLTCVSGNVNLNGSPIANGTLTISGFDFGLGLYYSL